MTTPSPATGRAIRYLGIALLLASFFHFLFFVSGILLSDLQLDFASLYAAGLDLNHGADPYVNHIARDPKLWDSFAPLQTSRYLYPPLAGSIFQLLALTDYGTAKELWTGFIIVCVILSIALQGEAVRYQFGVTTWIYIAACGLIFLPFTAEIERGQIDALCLLLLSLSLYTMIRPKPRPILSGVFLALASLFKLHCGLLLLYLLVKKQFKITAGFIAAWIVLAAVSVALYGWQMQVNYLTIEMPRISKYACYGTEGMRVDPLVMGMNNHGTPLGFVTEQDTAYALDTMRISAFAGIPFYSKVLLQSKFAFGTWAIITAIFIFGLVCLGEIEIKSRGSSEETPLSRYVYWQIGFMAVLLSGPITWLMNSVWLMPLIPLCFHYFPRIRGRHDAIGWTLLLTGLAISGFPDESGGELDMPLTYLFCIVKPIVGEMLCFVGLLRIYFTLRTTPAE